MPEEVGDDRDVGTKQDEGDDPSAGMGLRERKHRATHRAIVTAALDIFEKSGYGAVTIEAICQCAGVSKRTFFNYFSSKDAVLVGEGMACIPTEKLKTMLESSAPDVLIGVAVAIAQEERSSYHDITLEHRRHKVLASEPELIWQHMRQGRETGKALHAGVVDFLTEHPSLRRVPTISIEDESRLIVMMAFLSIKQAGHRYYAASTHEEDQEDLTKYYEQLIGHMRAILGDGSRKDADANL